MLQRPFERDRSCWPTTADALAMATVAGGKAMLEPALGTLAPGAPADFVLHDLTAAFWTPLNDPLHQLVFGGSGSTVDTVIVAGRVLVEAGRIVAFDVEPVLSEVRELVRHLRARNHALHATAARLAATL
jgi:5-methylthioadenosine/S-adenosylhomocysteine deaminase